MFDVSSLRSGFVLAALCAAALAACTGDAGDGGAAADSADHRDSASASARGGGAAADSARRVASISGFNTPESVRYDADQDLYFVSNINGNPSAKDGNGWIARVRPDSAGGNFSVDTLVRGGRSGATLNAPKGMAIVGDTLWVTDIDVVRGFNRRTGAPTRTVSFASQGATFLNDIVAAGDGVYITDTGIRFNPDGQMGTPGKQRIFRFGGRGAGTVALENDSLGNPNGIAMQGGGGRFVVVPFGANRIYTWASGDSTMQPLATGPGQFDGVEVLQDGRILVSSWADSAVHVIQSGQNQTRRLITGVPAPADIGIDTRRNRVLVPLFNGNTVEVWSIGGR